VNFFASRGRTKRHSPEKWAYQKKKKAFSEATDCHTQNYSKIEGEGTEGPAPDEQTGTGGRGGGSEVERQKE